MVPASQVNAPLARNAMAYVLAGGRGSRTATTSRLSSRAPTTVVQSAPGRGTRAKRDRSMPWSAAASADSSGNPTAALQEPCSDGPASSASTSDMTPMPPETSTVLPRRAMA